MEKGNFLHKKIVLTIKYYFNNLYILINILKEKSNTASYKNIFKSIFVVPYISSAPFKIEYTVIVI